MGKNYYNKGELVLVCNNSRNEDKHIQKECRKLSCCHKIVDYNFDSGLGLTIEGNPPSKQDFIDFLLPNNPNIVVENYSIEYLGKDDNDEKIFRIRAVIANLIYLDIESNSCKGIAKLPVGLTTLLASNNQLQHLPQLPETLDTINISGNNFTTAQLDIVAKSFLKGNLPKTLWNSEAQLTGDEPSVAVVADLNVDVITVTV